MASVEERHRTKSSPLVRKIAAQHESCIDISQIKAGLSNRVTRTIFWPMSRRWTPSATARSGSPTVLRAQHRWVPGDACGVSPTGVFEGDHRRPVGDAPEDRRAY
ncbi:MAG: hypothetical protein R3C68_13510 [Myxococcota bacterium]